MVFHQGFEFGPMIVHFKISNPDPKYTFLIIAGVEDTANRGSWQQFTPREIYGAHGDQM